MKEPYGEGLASHPDPESCGDVRKDGAEALTGESAGAVLSCEIRSSGVPTPLSEAEGNIGGDVTRKSSANPAQSQTRSMRRSSLHGNREIPCVPTLDGEWAGRGKPKSAVRPT